MKNVKNTKVLSDWLLGNDVLLPLKINPTELSGYRIKIIKSIQ